VTDLLIVSQSIDAGPILSCTLYRLSIYKDKDVCEVQYQERLKRPDVVRRS
jgi:hypothetical protein